MDRRDILIWIGFRSGQVSVPYASFNWIRFYGLARASQPRPCPYGQHRSTPTEPTA